MIRFVKLSRHQYRVQKLLRVEWSIGERTSPRSIWCDYGVLACTHGPGDESLTWYYRDGRNQLHRVGFDKEQAELAKTAVTMRLS